MIQWDTFLLFTSTNKFSPLQKDAPNATSVEAQPVVMENDTDESAKKDDDDNNTEGECNELASEIYDLIRIIKDPEKPQTLEELNVVQEKGITVTPISDTAYLVRIEFVPTVPHCSLATLIGLCLRVKLERNLSHKFKLDIVLQKGSHATETEINKQINDKERIAAAMENPNLREVVENCVHEDD